MNQEKEHACPSVDDDEQGALEGLLELNTDRDNVGQKHPWESENLTERGKERVYKGDTRVRQFKESVQGKFDDKPRVFRLATAAAAAHAEDCYWMWCYWNEDPAKHVDVNESNFRYKPAVYLNDVELERALKKITRADEMERYLKARYRVAIPINMAIPITLDTACMKSDSQLTSIVKKATVDGKQLKTTEIYTLLERASELPISPAPPMQPPACSLFLFDKAATPQYKKDQHTIRKEAHYTLVVNKEPRIQVYYGSKDDHSLQRRSYFLLSDRMVLVHYLVPLQKPVIELK